jgi:hypothetical protein
VQLRGAGQLAGLHLASIVLANGQRQPRDAGRTPQVLE